MRQYETVDRIRRSHRAARPNPAENPAWANCHMDCGVLLAEIDRLQADLELLQRAGVTVRDSRHGTRMVVIESSPNNQ